MISLDGQVALVTGGSRGLGRAIAVLFARAGAAVVINYRSDRSAAEQVVLKARELGVEAQAVQANVADKAAVDDMVARVVETFGRIDCLVNNAGIWIHNPIEELTEERLRETIDINLIGTYLPTMAVVAHMKRQRRGTIINISSTAGQRGEAFYSPYGATKGAVIALTKSLAAELAKDNIRVNCVAPGWFDTDMARPALEGDGMARVTGQIPLGRVGRPEELAGAVVFLASDLATFITGEILNVNGGAVLCG
jgi:3-oxoacyl-[acyl-carrier protein] reductase